MAKTWFSNAFGFLESDDYDRNQGHFVYNETTHILVSNDNKRRFFVGPFETPSLHKLEKKLEELELEQRLGSDTQPDLGDMRYEPNLRGDVKLLHTLPENNGSVFMVASQFNTLEMVGPSITPEHGITNYISDKTQGPACALACPAALVFRNYFWNGQGQGKDRQLNNLRRVEALLSHSLPPPKPNSPATGPPFWRMKNGYCLPTTGTSMAELSEALSARPELTASVRGAVQVGVHWETQVGARDSEEHQQHHQRVCQVLCSALPVAYCRRTRRREDWECFASLVLEAAFEATLCVASLLARRRGQRVRVFLTKLGGGAFANNTAWVQRALLKACTKYARYPLDVFLVRFA